MTVGAERSEANADRKDVGFDLNSVDEKKGYNTDDKRTDRKSLRPRAAPMTTTQWRTKDPDRIPLSANKPHKGDYKIYNKIYNIIILINSTYDEIVENLNFSS